MRQVLEAFLDELRSGRRAVLATIVRASGSTPRTLGTRMIVRSFRPSEVEPPPSVAVSRRGSYWQGFVAQGANPNLLIYFTALLPQFVDPARPLQGQIAILAGSSFVIEFTVLSVYAALAFRAGRRAAPRFRLVAERLGGGLLVAAGAGLASLRRK